MSRRGIVIGIVIAVLAVLVANGTTLAVAGPHAVAAKKHHKKKKEEEQHKGGAASGCSGTLSPFENRTWHLVVKCTSGYVQPVHGHNQPRSRSEPGNWR